MGLLFSARLEPADRAALPGAIRRAVTMLEGHPEVEQVYAVGRRGGWVWVGVCVGLGRHLPPRYNADLHGVLTTEPVLFLFDEADYPTKPPLVGSDRIDFQWEGKPHVSAAGVDHPPFFCLARVPMEEWFAVHGFASYIDRTIGWLRDAALGLLQREDGRFEPTIVPPTGFRVVFDYSRVSVEAEREKARAPRRTSRFASFQFLHPSLRDARDSTLTLRYAGAVSDGRMAGLARDAALKVDAPVNWRAGVLAWTPPGREVDAYFSTLPATAGELFGWASNLGIDLESAIERVEAETVGRAQGDAPFVAVPVLVAIERPRRLFGVDTHQEILGFIYFAGGKQLSSCVFPLQHQHPLNPQRAAELSGVPLLDLPAVLIGAGSLGSKLFSHWYRAGHVRWTVVEPDPMLPHNAVRHALLGGTVGLTKGAALQQAVAGIFEGVDIRDTVRVVPRDIQAALREAPLRKHLRSALVIDATASQAALLRLTASDAPTPRHFARTAILDRGRKGILLLEGPNRNPRADDILAFVHGLATSEEVISEWLRRQAGDVDEAAGLIGAEVELGLACGSDTLRLSDDAVSLHAAQISSRLRQWVVATAESTVAGTGRVGLSDVDAGWTEWNVPPFEVLHCGEWTVRISALAGQTMRELMASVAPAETGGVLLGRIDMNRLTIHVTEALRAPADSAQSPSRFVRGTESVSESHERAYYRSGGTIGYVAEWHTHPSSTAQPSVKDLLTIANTARTLRGAGFPVVVVIASPSGISAVVADDLSS